MKVLYPRLINSRFVEGAITNAIGFDELDISYVAGPDARPFAASLTYDQILKIGDVQLVAPLDNVAGNFLVAVISGIIFSIDLDTCLATDITPQDACLPTTSCTPLSYLDNDGGVYGAGGFLVIFNWPNRPIFINQDGARVSDEDNYEMPPSRLGATAGLRSFVISGDNTLYASDPFGGANELAPLTFQETLEPGADYFGQTYTIGNVLNNEYVTAICRLPKFLGPNQEFLAQSILVSTRHSKYIVAAGAPRDSWDNIQFITYAGSLEGVAGPLACTNIGDNLVYMSTGGRIKNISQDQARETGLVENFFDEPLGQYLCCQEANFHFRDWYRTLDHSRSVLKFHRDRLYATVYPKHML